MCRQRIVPPQVDWVQAEAALCPMRRVPSSGEEDPNWRNTPFRPSQCTRKTPFRINFMTVEDQQTAGSSTLGSTRVELGKG
jgi:hypothetical protein